MIIKKYIVSDMKEAMVRAKYELGKDAVIISERKIKEGSWFNPFKKNKIEVTIAIEDDVMNSTVKSNVEISKAKEIYMEQSKSIEDKEKKSDVKTENIKLQENKEELETKAYPDFNDCNTDEIIEFIHKNKPDNCFEKKKEFSKINALIGPTGVGKTTTIAKLASIEYLVNKNKVGLITMDTYRIGAVDQLKTYASILGIPCEVVEKPEDMHKKIDKLCYCDLLLIDTVGTSHRNNEKIDDIERYLADIAESYNKYLVLSISTDTDTTNAIMDRYEMLGYDALVLTKFDEVHTLKNFWNIIEHNNKPVQYFCFGQDVPEDIQSATLKNVLSYLWGELVT